MPAAALTPKGEPQRWRRLHRAGLIGTALGCIVSLALLVQAQRDLARQDARLQSAVREVGALVKAHQAGEPAAADRLTAVLARLEGQPGQSDPQPFQPLTHAFASVDMDGRTRADLFLALALGLGLAFVLLLGWSSIRDRRLSNRALAVQRQAAAESAAKSVFLATVSHEVRTPLNAIGGFAELIERQPFGPVGHKKYLEYVRDIIASSQHLEGLLDDVVDTQQILAGQVTLQESEILLRPFLAETLRIVRANCLGRFLSPRIVTRVEPLALVADRRRLRQVLINLLNNAIRYADGRAEIVIVAQVVNGAPEFLVGDQGPGLPPDFLERAFEPFQRGEGKRVGGRSGMGLGLTIVRNIVNAHGGMVWIENGSAATDPPVAGAVVRFRLPPTRLLQARQVAAPWLVGVAAE